IRTMSTPCDGNPPDIPTFPTRRSSDLRQFLHDFRLESGLVCKGLVIDGDRGDTRLAGKFKTRRTGTVGKDGRHFRRKIRGAAGRSEEHTSELQSRENLVCRLLLEKKKP